MTTARQKAIARKRRLGVRPRCRKRTLTPRAIQKAEQTLGTGPGELNPDFSDPLPSNVQNKPRRGAPIGNSNRLRNGKYTRRALDFRARVRAHLQQARALVAATRKMLRGDPSDIIRLGDMSGVPGDGG